MMYDKGARRLSRRRRFSGELKNKRTAVKRGLKAAICTLGCKVNQYESNEMAVLLRREGWEIVPHTEAADAYIVNSCTVTAESSRKSGQTARRLRRAHPEAVIVLAGCYAQAFANEALAQTGADLVIGNNRVLELPALLREALENREKRTAVAPHALRDPYVGGAVSEFEGHTRAFIKIQDGCNRRCSYCIIPTARGFSRSKPLDQIRGELEGVAANGYKEAVFVGINLSAYGRDLGADLADALLLAQETPGIRRIRLGSLEPDHITDELIGRLAALDKFCPQFHLSLQSGSDVVLRRMNRHYTAAEYRALCEKLRAAFPALSLTTDLIAGFPGETEAEFEESLRFAREIGFMKIHVFPYSARAGTPAAALPDQIEKAVKTARCARQQETADNLRRDYLTALTGRTEEVLFETPKLGLQTGYTAAYAPVRVPSPRRLTGEILPVKITGVEEDACTGTLI